MLVFVVFCDVQLLAHLACIWRAHLGTRIATGTGTLYIFTDFLIDFLFIRRICRPIRARAFPTFHFLGFSSFSGYTSAVL